MQEKQAACSTHGKPQGRIRAWLKVVLIFPVIVCVLLLAAWAALALVPLPGGACSPARDQTIEFVDRHGLPLRIEPADGELFSQRVPYSEIPLSPCACDHRRRGPAVLAAPGRGLQGVHPRSLAIACKPQDYLRRLHHHSATHQTVTSSPPHVPKQADRSPAGAQARTDLEQGAHSLGVPQPNRIRGTQPGAARQPRAFISASR